MKLNRDNITAASALALVLSFASTRADAQSMDYTSLQSLFGEPVTTGATGTPQKASEVAADMTILTADDIRRSGARNVPEALRSVPGLEVTQVGMNGYDVGVRGYGAAFQPRLLVLVDGRQVFLDDYSRTEWSNIPVNIDDIRQIEVVKGAASALFGSNAAGGVINIITNHPLYDNDRVASVRIGAHNLLQGDGTVTEKFGSNLGVKVSAGGMDSDQYHRGWNDTELTSSDISNPRQRYIIQNSAYQINPNAQANFETSYSESTANDGVFNGHEAREHLTSYSVRGGADVQTAWGAISSNNYINHTFNRYDEQYAGGIGAATTLIVSQLQDQFKGGLDHTFRVGLEFRHKELTYSSTENLDVPSKPQIDNNVYAASGTWLWNINSKLSWTNAVRYDHSAVAQGGTVGPNALIPESAYNRTDNTLTGNSGLVYKYDDKDTFRVTYGRGAQLPSLVQLGFTDAFLYPPYGANVVVDFAGNPNVKPTIVTNYELGWDRKIDSLDSVFKLSPFYQTNQNLVGFNVDRAAGRVVGFNEWIPYEAQNAGNSDGFGTEIELKGSNSAGYRWDASYSYARVVDNSLARTVVQYENSLPQHDIRLSGGYTTGKWEFDGLTQFETSSDMNATSEPSYYNVSGRIGYKVTDNFTAALSGTNVTRHYTQETLFPAVERQGMITLTGKF